MDKQKKLMGLIVALVAVICVALFGVLGFITHQWHLVWLVFLLVPIAALIGQIIIGRSKTGPIIGLVAVICAGVVVVLGFMTGQWHLVWMVLLIVPITVLIMQIVKAARGY